jgi:hypothetical protein
MRRLNGGIAKTPLTSRSAHADALRGFGVPDARSGGEVEGQACAQQAGGTHLARPPGRALADTWASRQEGPQAPRRSGRGFARRCCAQRRGWGLETAERKGGGAAPSRPVKARMYGRPAPSGAGRGFGRTYGGGVEVEWEEGGTARAQRAGGRVGGGAPCPARQGGAWGGRVDVGLGVRNRRMEG